MIQYGRYTSIKTMRMVKVSFQTGVASVQMDYGKIMELLQVKGEASEAELSFTYEHPKNAVS